MSTSESLSRPESCPDLEEIAAFVDRRLPKEERPRLMAHFADCPDCYEIFAATARFHLDERQKAGGKVVPFWRRRYAQIGVAAAAVLAVVVGFFVFRSFSVRPVLPAGLVSASTAAAVNSAWLEPAKRGSGAGTGVLAANAEDRSRREFQIGVQAVNVQTGLAGDKAERALNALRQLRPLLEAEIYLDQEANAYKEIFGALLTKGRPRKFLPIALRNESQLQQALESVYYDLGRWAEAGLLAAEAQDAGYFQRADTRKLTRWLSRRSQGEIKPEALQAIAAIRKISGKSSLEPEDYEELESQFEKVLRVYYPEGQREP